MDAYQENVKPDPTVDVTSETHPEPGTKIEKQDPLWILNVLFALISLGLLIFSNVILNFGPNNRNVIRGIMGIFVYGSAFAGVVVSILKNKKPDVYFWLNIGVLVADLRFL